MPVWRCSQRRVHGLGYCRLRRPRGLRRSACRWLLQRTRMFCRWMVDRNPWSRSRPAIQRTAGPERCCGWKCGGRRRLRDAVGEVVVTNGSGRATFTYTAPPGSGGVFDEGDADSGDTERNRRKLCFAEGSIGLIPGTITPARRTHCSHFCLRTPPPLTVRFDGTGSTAGRGARSSADTSGSSGMERWNGRHADPLVFSAEDITRSS